MTDPTSIEDIVETGGTIEMPGGTSLVMKTDTVMKT
jgi:hypothetical protein